MMLDLIIPVYRPDDKLKRLLKGIAAQTVKPDNIIIMYTRISPDDHLSPEYIDLALNAVTFHDRGQDRSAGCGGSYSEKRHHTGDVRVYEIDRNEFDHGGTRALAVSYSKAGIFMMMTMDAVPHDEHMIEELIAVFDRDMYVAAAYGRQLPGKESGLAERFTRGFNYPGESAIKSRDDIGRLGIKAFFCSNVCAVYRRDVYDKLGGFIDRTVFNEDMIYAHKLIMNGYRIYYAAKAGVIHTHEYTPMQQFHRNFDLAVSQAMHPEVFASVSSESEGMKYIKAAYAYFRKSGKGYMIIPFLWGCCFRYAGYFLGKKYEKLPKRLVRACAMNKEFFT